MRTVHLQLAAAAVGSICLLALLDAVTALGALAWVTGLAWSIGVIVVLGRALVASCASLGPANAVTLARAVLVGAVVAIAVESADDDTHLAVATALAAVALTLDAVDGVVARRTRNATRLGARFDMEVDAFLILVLSVMVAPAYGWWVLLIGAARYLFVGAGRVWPWLRGDAPARPWCKAVAAFVGVALVVALSGALPTGLGRLLLLVGLLGLAESFGREAWELWRLRHLPVAPVRPVLPVVGTALAFALVWAALVLPNQLEDVSADMVVRVPIEAVVLIGALMLVRGRAGRVISIVAGVALALITVLAVLDVGFITALDRPFDPTVDWVYLGSAVGVLGDSIGAGQAAGVAVLCVAAAVLLLIVMPVATMRLASVAGRHRGVGTRAVAVLAVVWLLLAMTGVRLGGNRLASAEAVNLAYDEVARVHADMVDRSRFQSVIDADPYEASGDQLLGGLRGKDVLLVFVESYGRVAVQDTTFSPGVDRVLDEGTRRLEAGGYSARSAFLTSPTFGGASWLAHSTTQSGVWVDDERRYRQLLSSDRMTLSSAFKDAGWRTVLDVPANTKDWPEGIRYYGVDKLYDSRDVGYQGPKFGYAPMPDQYVLDAFRRLELAKPDRLPVMAELDLVSSHHPWAPLPRQVSWSALGDGSIFDEMPGEDLSSKEVFKDPDLVREYYGRSIEYTWNALVSFLLTYPDPDLVVVVLGDHQPHQYVTGRGVGHDVPISVITQDAQAMSRIDDWRWEPGINPSPTAPVWRMDAFRDRFLEAYR